MVKINIIIFFHYWNESIFLTLLGMRQGQQCQWMAHDSCIALHRIPWSEKVRKKRNASWMDTLHHTYAAAMVYRSVSTFSGPHNQTTLSRFLSSLPHIKRVAPLQSNSTLSLSLSNKIKNKGLSFPRETRVRESSISSQNGLHLC
jgi:hypothetical protein